MADLTNSSEWEDYRLLYHSFVASLHQGRVMATVGAETLGDFPASLPDTLRDNLLEWLQNFFSGMRAALSAIEKGEKPERSPPIQESGPGHRNMRLYAASLMMYMVRSLLGLKMEALSFRRYVYSQEFVMLFAQFDAFMNDTVRTICRARPQVLKSSKRSLDWETLATLGNWESIRDYMTEVLVKDLSFGGVSKRLEFLRKRGVKVDFADSDLQSIMVAMEARNCIVHNASRVTEKYRRMPPEGEVKLGGEIELSDDSLDSLVDTVQWLSGEIFLGVSEKFFGISRDSPPAAVWIWRQERLEPSRLETLH